MPPQSTRLYQYRILHVPRPFLLWLVKNAVASCNTSRTIKILLWLIKNILAYYLTVKTSVDDQGSFWINQEIQVKIDKTKSTCLITSNDENLFMLKFRDEYSCTRLDDQHCSTKLSHIIRSLARAKAAGMIDQHKPLPKLPREDQGWWSIIDWEFYELIGDGGGNSFGIGDKCHVR